MTGRPPEPSPRSLPLTFPPIQTFPPHKSVPGQLPRSTIGYNRKQRARHCSATQYELDNGSVLKHTRQSKDREAFDRALLQHHWESLLQSWPAKGELSPRDAQEIGRHFPEFLTRNPAAIASTADSDEALDRFTELTTLTNQASQKDPKLIAKLGRHTSKLRNAARDLALRVGAESFSISVSFPGEVSVSFTFPIELLS